MDWFLYDRDLRHERIEQLNENCQYRFSYLSLDLGKLLMLQSLLQSSEYISVSCSEVLLQKYFGSLTKLEANKPSPSFTIFPQIIITCHLKIVYKNKVIFLKQLFQFVIYTFYANESSALW